MTQTWYVLANPKAGKGQAKRIWAKLASRLANQGFQFHWLVPRSTEEVSQAVADAIAKGVRRLLIVGGDGTHHHAINGLMRQRICPPEEIAYALYPAGTGNDWVRTHRIPHQEGNWCAMFQAQQYARQDIGLIEARDPHGQTIRRYFANVAGLGFDAEVVRYLVEQDILETGDGRYFRAIYRCLQHYRPVPLRVETNMGSFEAPYYTLSAGICRFNGHGMCMVPHANPLDGQLAYTFIKPVPAWRVAINTPWLYTPFFNRHPMAVAGHSRTVSITHTGEQPSLIEADGELIGQTPVRIQVLPSKLRFVAPVASG